MRTNMQPDTKMIEFAHISSGFNMQTNMQFAHIRSGFMEVLQMDLI